MRQTAQCSVFFIPRGGVQWQVQPPVMAVMIISDSWVIKAAVNCWLLKGLQKAAHSP